MRTEAHKSAKTPPDTGISEKMRFETQIEQPQYERHRRSWATLKWFEETPKTEDAFYLRFQDLPDEDAVFLKSFYNLNDDWELFKKICSFWSVKISG